MDYTKLMKPGTNFTAKNALGETHRYQFVGLDLHDMICGTGCSYVILRDRDTGHEMGVESQWFKFREISDVDYHNIIEVPCAAGMLCGEISGDPERWPGVYTYFRRPDGVQVDLCGVEGDAVIPKGMTADDVDGQKKYNGGLAAFMWEDTSKEDYTYKHTFSREEMNREYD